MSDIKLTSALPKGDANGLDPIASKLVSHPKDMYVALVIMDCKKVTVDNDTGEAIPTARIRRIEAILPDDIKTARRLFERALEKRTGRTVLPLGLEDEVRAAFDLEDGDGGS